MAVHTTLHAVYLICCYALINVRRRLALGRVTLANFMAMGSRRFKA
jgi:hypothetical protein